MSGRAETVAVVPKNAYDEVRVGLNDYKGHQLLDVRVFTNRGRIADAYVATTMGVSLRIEQLEALRAALNVAAREARKRGWLTGPPHVGGVIVHPAAAGADVAG